MSPSVSYLSAYFASTVASLARGFPAGQRAWVMEHEAQPAKAVRQAGLAALRGVVKQFLGLRAYGSINQAVERQACSAIRVWVAGVGGVREWRP